MGPSLREKQRTQVRRDIDAAALRLFVERGYDRVTTDEIAAAAGVSPSTYYRYVPTKEDLLLRPLRASSAAIVAGFAAQPDGLTIVDALIAAVRTQTADVDDEEMRQWQSVVLAVPGVAAKMTLIDDADKARLIEMAAARMDLDPEADFRPGVTVCTVLAVVEYAYRRWMSAEDPDASLLGVIDAAIAASAFSR
ncbi:TetR/AcrR family transcriptional regulator [Gordonia metallireducens]|uniref:TetR/AcrR family transcriptional regulator n=1 Tax=Gordonia metallireducens TaxID=2897779 RepID=UPI001E2D13F9|nr:TetR/AcrR family transcriptional regulator [Gordonia metallireducens]